MSVADRVKAEPENAAAALYPDPLLSANLYASRRLDAVLLGGVVPLWRRVGPEVEASGGYLWTVRYSRGGEHLKLRLHAAEELAPRLRAAAEETLTRCLAALPASDEERRLRDDAPAIDAEDEAEEAPPDETLLWTRYRRSYVSLGGEPWLGGDGYAARLTALLGAGFGLLAAAVGEGGGDEIPHGLRKKTLLRALVDGVAALGLAPRAGAYLAYHRDWLLRFFVQEPEREAAFLAKLDEQVAALPALAEQLRAVTAESWGAAAGAAQEGSEEGAGGTGAAATWRRAAARLAAYVGAFRGREEYRTDPLADDPLYPAAFKALHGTANQLGLSPMEEAYVHHLLWHAAGGAAAQGGAEETAS